jgi:UDP-N-acetyl-D-mannosaminuronic acid dehydrogenase
LAHIAEISFVLWSRLLGTSREMSDGIIVYWAERILQQCLKINKPLSSIKICIKGITFRAGVKVFYHSCNLALVRLLAEKGLDVYVSDPILFRYEVEGKGLRFIKYEESDLVFAPIELNFNSTGEVR